MTVNEFAESENFQYTTSSGTFKALCKALVSADQLSGAQSARSFGLRASASGTQIFIGERRAHPKSVSASANLRSIWSHI